MKCKIQVHPLSSTVLIPIGLLLLLNYYILARSSTFHFNYYILVSSQLLYSPSSQLLYSHKVFNISFQLSLLRSSDSCQPQLFFTNSKNTKILGLTNYFSPLLFNLQLYLTLIQSFGTEVQAILWIEEYSVFLFAREYSILYEECAGIFYVLWKISYISICTGLPQGVCGQWQAGW